MEHKKHVIVIGAGIIGASIAWHVARSGAQVTVIDAGEVGGVATPCSFGWVNATYGCPHDYFKLRTASMAAWRIWGDAIPGLPYRECGTVYLHFDGGDGAPVDLSTFASAHTDWGYDIGVVEGETLRTFTPNVRDLPEVGLWAPSEGVAEGHETAQLLIKDCVELGATLITGTPVEQLVTKGETVTGVRTRLGVMNADEVVVAIGAACPDLLGDVAPHIPIKTPQGILIHTKPHAPLIPHITLTKDLHIRQTVDGNIIAGWDFGGGSGPSDPNDAANALLEKIRATFHGADDVTLDDVTIGYRPTPQDGFPVVGRPGDVPGLVVAVMHSGITLAPIVGQAVAQLIEGRAMNALLLPYGPDRFAGV